MAAQADFEESNIALLGSDADKECRLKAAETVEAYKGAGKKEGLEVWRIESFKVVPWPEAKIGTFYSGDSFICLHTYKTGESDKFLYNIHFWLGKETSQDEAGVAAYMTVVLDDLLGTTPVQYREVQDHETDTFMDLFEKKGGMRILEGGVASGFNHVEPDSYKPRLLQVKGTRKAMRVRQVPLSCASMNQGDVFIFDNGLTLVEWHGSNAGVFEKRRGHDIIDSIKAERDFKPKCEIVDGCDDHETMWDILEGDKADIKTKAEGGSDKQAKSDHTNKIHRLSDATGTLKITEEASGDDLKRDTLDSNDVFIVDLGHKIFCWVGGDASPNERRKGMKYATDFLQKTGRPMYTPIIKVVEGGESRDFNKVFAA